MLMSSISAEKEHIYISTRKILLTKFCISYLAKTTNKICSVCSYLLVSVFVPVCLNVHADSTRGIRAKRTAWKGCKQIKTLEWCRTLRPAWLVGCHHSSLSACHLDSVVLDKLPYSTKNCKVSTCCVQYFMSEYLPSKGQMHTNV